MKKLKMLGATLSRLEKSKISGGKTDAGQCSATAQCKTGENVQCSSTSNCKVLGPLDSKSPHDQGVTCEMGNGVWITKLCDGNSY
jgi:hypothetical protein